MDEILARYPQVDFHFVGRGFAEDTKHVVVKQRQWGRRVQWYSLRPEEMPQAYQSANITLIPTLYSEGTSLSCLEALACGNAVIATRIGGLTDLIINDHNGLLIEPQAEALKLAIVDLVENPEKMRRLQANGLQAVRAFSKERWEQSWIDVLQQENASVAKCERADPAESRTRLIDFYASNPGDENFRPLLKKLLQHGFLLHVRVREKDQRLVESSFQRLQFVPWDEALETVPDLVVASADAASLSAHVDLRLSGDPGRDVTSILDHFGLPL
jgi:hypothetical protein